MIIFFVNLKKLYLTPKNDFGIRGSFFENLKMAFWNPPKKNLRGLIQKPKAVLFVNHLAGINEPKNPAKMPFLDFQKRTPFKNDYIC